MKTLSLSQAARRVGKSKTAISRAIQEGRLNARRAANGHYEIDPADLLRAFPLADQTQQNADSIAPAEQPAAEAETAGDVAASEAAIADQPVATVIAEQPVAAAIADQPLATAIVDQPLAAAIADQPLAAAIADQPLATAIADQPLATAIADQAQSPVDVMLEAGAKHSELASRPVQTPKDASSLRNRFFNVADPVRQDAEKLVRCAREFVTARFSKKLTLS